MRAQARRCATVPLGHGLVPISFYRKRRLVLLKVLCFHSVCLKRQCSVSQGRWPVVTVQFANGYCFSQYCSFNILHKFSGHKSACLCPRSCGWVSIYKCFNRMGWFLYIFQSIHGNIFSCQRKLMYVLFISILTLCLLCIYWLSQKSKNLL